MAKNKKSTKSYFVSNPEVKLKLKLLKQLKKTKEKIENEIKKIFEDYNNRSKISVAEAEKLFDRLPLSNLKELQDFAAGKKRETSMETLKIRSNLKKVHSEKVKELENINQQIMDAEQDLLHSKINCVIKKLEES